MKYFSFFKNNIIESEQENFRRHLIFDNINRGKILAILVIGIELILIIVDCTTAMLQVDERFHFYQYCAMYASMIFLNIVYFVLIRKYKSVEDIQSPQVKKLETMIIVYFTSILSWSSIISLMDQQIYGQVVVFMVNMMVCSIVFLLDYKKIFIPYVFSVAILFIGLPFYQSSNDVLIGHYVNLTIFISISWLASRIIYQSYGNDYNSKVLLNKSNSLLAKEIKCNKEANMKLSIANYQLKKLALIDELTGLPNRRSFRNYIDMLFNDENQQSVVLSIIMIDVDYFKHYNDHYGHDKGDEVLIALAFQLQSIIVDHVEFVARWGGEEFIYATVNKDEKAITEKADILIQKVHDLKIPHGYSQTSEFVSISLGTCTLQINHKEDVRKGIELADKALYLAKNSGRNCFKNMEDDTIVFQPEVSI